MGRLLSVLMILHCDSFTPLDSVSRPMRPTIIGMNRTSPVSLHETGEVASHAAHGAFSTHDVSHAGMNYHGESVKDPGVFAPRFMPLGPRFSATAMIVRSAGLIWRSTLNVFPSGNL